MDKLDIRDIKEDFCIKSFIGKVIKGRIIDLEFIFPSNYKSAKFLRDAVEVICKKLQLAPDVVTRLILVVDELNNNSIEYGSAEGEDNKMRFCSRQENDGLYLNIEVEDSGNGSRPKKASEMRELRDKKLFRGFDHYDSIRGRGLFMIIIKIVDDLYFKDSDTNGLIVGVTKKI